LGLHSSPNLSASHRLETASKHQSFIRIDNERSRRFRLWSHLLYVVPKDERGQGRALGFPHFFSCIRRILNMKMNNRTIFYVVLLALLLTGLSAARALAQDISGAIVGL
jgi:hypothetical protein